MPDQPKSYLICTTHRTGSTLLCEALLNSAVGGMPREYFSPKHGAKLAAEAGVERKPEDGLLDYLQELTEKCSSANKVFAAKVMYEHLPAICDEIAGAHDAGRDSRTDAGWLSQVLPDLRFIWLRRENLVLQAISHWKLKQTRVSHLREGQGEKAPKMDPVYDYGEIRKARDRFQKHDEAWQAFFSEAGIAPLEVSYEVFPGRLEETVSEALAFLEIKPAQNYEAPPTTLRKWLMLRPWNGMSGF